MEMTWGMAEREEKDKKGVSALSPMDRSKQKRRRLHITEDFIIFNIIIMAFHGQSCGKWKFHNCLYRPWNRANGAQKLDDGIIEVIGLTTYTLPLLQAGAHWGK